MGSFHTISGAMFATALAAAMAGGASAQSAYLAAVPRQIVTQTPPAASVCRNCAQPYAEIPLTPPANFDPVRASDAQLEAYGFPPRPDAAAAPGEYAVWKSVVTLPAKRITPQLQATTIANGPAKITAVSQGATAYGVTSPNWSGYAINDTNNPFAAPKTYVYGSYIVPTAQQAFGTCSSTEVYSSQWIGIDGLNSSDVFQAGSEADATCSGGVTNAYYAPWYEWYPNSEVRITNFPISPGDLISLYIWNTSTTKGDFYMVDQTTNSYTTLSFKAPHGTTLQGNSVEWILEQPQVGGSLSSLTNYVTDPWYYCHAKISGGATYSPGSAPTGQLYSLTMQANSANISYADTSTNNGLTYVNPSATKSDLAGTALWFFDEGAAR
jgi:Peptidase A4 family